MAVSQNYVQKWDLDVVLGTVSGGPISLGRTYNLGEEMGRGDTNSLRFRSQVARAQGATSEPIREDFLSLRNLGL